MERKFDIHVKEMHHMYDDGNGQSPALQPSFTP